MRFSIRRDKRHAIYRRDGYCCVYCGCRVNGGGLSGIADSATLDHVTPQARGGGNEAKNLVTSCWTCNSSKKDDNFVVFAERLSARLGVIVDPRELYARARNHARRSIKSHREWAKTQGY